MPDIIIEINGRPYTMACEEGQQGRIRLLAKMINDHIQSLVDSLGQIGDQRLLLMTVLDLADELTRRKKMQKSEKISNQDQISGNIKTDKEEQKALKDQKKLIVLLDKMSARIERMSEELSAESLNLKKKP